MNRPTAVPGLCSIRFSLIGLAALAIGLPAMTSAQSAPTKLYELRIYTANPGKIGALHARFRDHTLKLFEKHGIENLYYWTIAEGAEGDDLANTLVYLVAHKDKASADAAWQAFLNDPEWQTVARASEADGPLLAKPPASIYLNPTDFSPPDGPVNAGASGPARLFELRQYDTGAAGLPATVERMRNGEADLFRTHGMETLHFWTTADGEAYIYLLAHKDRETARASWEGFFTEFRAMMARNAPAGGQQPAGPLSPFVIRFLTPTDYSPRR